MGTWWRRWFLFTTGLMAILIMIYLKLLQSTYSPINEAARADLEELLSSARSSRQPHEPTTAFTPSYSHSARHRNRIRDPIKSNDNALQLAGVKLNHTPYYQQPWNDSVELAPFLPYLHKPKHSSSYRLLSKQSFNSDIVARGQFQQVQMEKFCEQRVISKHLPSDRFQLDLLLSHLLYDDSKKLILCYVPKNGCSNIRTMMSVISGIISPQSLKTRANETTLRKLPSLSKLNQSEALYRLQTYYKTVIIRKPLVKILSAFIDKLKDPLTYTNHSWARPFPNNIKHYILKLFRGDEVENRISKQEHLNITFSEYIRYMTMFPLEDYNEHFVPVTNLCYPCAVKYDFYMNFDAMNYDVHALMHYLNIPMQHYPNQVDHIYYSTEDLLQDYFKSVSPEELANLLNTLSEEIDFYSSLYPL